MKEIFYIYHDPRTAINIPASTERRADSKKECIGIRRTFVSRNYKNTN